MPGTAALNKGHLAEITSVSCASAGNCSAGGYYTDRPVGKAFVWKVFVVSEVKGTWRKAEQVPGTAALNKDGNARLTSVSCASAGNCSAGGYYTAGIGGGRRQEAFVVREVHGTWRKAEEVPGIGALNKGGYAEITSVSCASVGNCSAGGDYQGGSDVTLAFVVSEVNGSWRKAEEVRGTAALHGSAAISSVSCASAGSCSAGGYYVDGPDGTQAFVVSEVHGIWRIAEEVPGIAALNKGKYAKITSVSCASAGNCSAGGDYQGGSNGTQAFVVSEVNGTWQIAEEVPGIAALTKSGLAGITSVSCGSAGSCSAGGWYADGSNGTQAFVVSEVKGTWRRAEEVPGTAKLNKGGDGGITSVSCASAGNCSAGGFYEARGLRAFVVSEVKGTWRRAEEVPGTAALSKGHLAEIISVSCASAGHCSAGGRYQVASSGGEAFVVSRK